MTTALAKTSKQAGANRRNARKSTGPRTEDGKPNAARSFAARLRQFEKGSPHRE